MEEGGGGEQLKIPPGGGFGRGCKISYIYIIFFFFGGGGPGQPGNPSGYTLFFGGGGHNLGSDLALHTLNYF